MARSLVVYHGQPWKRRRMRAMYGRFVRPGALCFDVGSHAGNRIRTFLDLGAKRVIAVEPQPDFVRLLMWLYGSKEAVSVLPIGLSDRAGSLKLRISSRTPTVSTFDAAWIASLGAHPGFDGVAWDDVVEVPVSTLDELIVAHGIPDFCKIDVEGFEAAVLGGLSQPLPALSFEYLPVTVARAHACIDRLEGLGSYRYWVSVGEQHKFVDEAPWDAAGLRAFLDATTTETPSGDVYAQLVTGHDA